MLQLAFIRENPDLVKERLAVKNFKGLELVDKILSLDEKRKQLQAKFDDIQSKIKSSSKTIGELMAAGKKDEVEKIKATVNELKPTLAPITAELDQVEKELQETLVQLPNLPAKEVPVGKSAEDNVVVREGGVKPQLPAGAAPHWDLLARYNLINFELGNKITGSGFPVYVGKGAKLERALISYFLDYNTAAGYKEYIPPFMVNEASAFGTGQLPDKEGQMYQVTADGLYLIPTAEVPVTNLYRDVILKKEELPIKMTAWSPCFRREAGSYGKDVRGLNRVHQFNKVEIVQITEPEKSHQALEEMVAHVEKLVQSLNLPYRILRLCGGDMGFASAITFDFEVYSAAQEKWLEVSSVSNFETYQTNRMKLRYKNDEGKNVFPHSLNGSSLALPRIVACLIENNQTEDGIKLPEVLHPYFGASLIN